MPRRRKKGTKPKRLLCSVKERHLCVNFKFVCHLQGRRSWIKKKNKLAFTNLVQRFSALKINPTFQHNSSLKLCWVVLILQHSLWNLGTAATTSANGKSSIQECFGKTLTSIARALLLLTVSCHATRQEHFSLYFCFNHPQNEDEATSRQPVRVPLTPEAAVWVKKPREWNRHRISTSPTQTPSVICFPFVPGLLIRGCLGLWSSVGG